MNEVKESDISTENNYSNKIREIAFETFETTCYMFPLEEWELDDAEGFPKPDGTIRSVVKFDGAAEGAMVIAPNSHLLESIAANMLGIDDPAEEEKDGALCEIANIICGNTVPVFAHNNEICYIRPPRIADPAEDFDKTYSDMSKESVEVILDEGIINISIYFKTGS